MRRMIVPEPKLEPVKKATRPDNLPIRIRDAVADDVPFIFNSWLKSFKHSYFGKSMPPQVFYSEHHKIIEHLLKKCNVKIACSETDVADIYGYACAENIDGIFVLHYIYVKHTYRMLGVGKMLLNQYEHDFKNAAICSHMTFTGEKLAAKYSLVHNPYTSLFFEYQTKKESSDE